MVKSQEYKILFESWRRYVNEESDLSARLKSEKLQKIEDLLRKGKTGKDIVASFSDDIDYSFIEDFAPKRKKELINKINSANTPGPQSVTAIANNILSILDQSIEMADVSPVQKKFKKVPFTPGVHPASKAQLVKFATAYVMLASLPILFDMVLSVLRNMGPLDAAVTAAIVALLSDPAAFTRWVMCISGNTISGGIDTASDAFAWGLKKAMEAIGIDIGKTKAEDMKIGPSAAGIVKSIVECFGIPLTPQQQQQASNKLKKDPTFIDKVKQTVSDVTSWFKNKVGLGGGTVSSSDEEALLRMLYAETGWNHKEEEMAAIVQVAVNRKVLRNASNFESVVRPLDSGWNNASSVANAKKKELKYQQQNPGKTKKFGSYEASYNIADKHFNSNKAKNAREIIKNVLSGNHPVGNLNGAQNWLHADIMKKCTEPHGTKIGNRYCFDYGELGWSSIGKRVVPTWAIQKGNGKGQLPVGTSNSRPRKVGRAIVSRENESVAKKLKESPNIVNSQGKKDITIIGDSLMPTRTKGIGYHIEKQFPGRVSNLSIGGKPMHGSSKDAIRKQYNRIPKSTKILIVNGGVNDTAGHQYREPKKNIENIVKAYKEIIQDARGKGIKVIIFPIVVPYKRKLPVKPGSSHKNSKPTADSRVVNKELKSMADGSDVIYIGGFEEISVDDKRKNLHPFRYYPRIAAAINKKIKEIEK
jgi:hypothetical protein